MKKYQVITYSSDVGANESVEFSRKRDAEAFAKEQLYFNPNGYGLEEGSLVYDLLHHSIVSVFGHFPKSARPVLDADA